MSDPIAERLEAIVARAKRRAWWCEHGDGPSHPATLRCVAGGDCNTYRCSDHAVAYDGYCDHKWEPTDDGTDADVAAMLAIVEALPKCQRDGCDTFATWQVDAFSVMCDPCKDKCVAVSTWLRPTELSYAVALRGLATGALP